MTHTILSRVQIDKDGLIWPLGYDLDDLDSMDLDGGLTGATDWCYTGNAHEEARRNDIVTCKANKFADCVACEVEAGNAVMILPRKTAALPPSASLLAEWAEPQIEAWYNAKTDEDERERGALALLPHVDAVLSRIDAALDEVVIGDVNFDAAIEQRMKDLASWGSNLTVPADAHDEWAEEHLATVIPLFPEATR